MIYRLGVGMGVGGTHDCNMAVYRPLVQIPLYPMGGFGSILKPHGFKILFFYLIIIFIINTGSMLWNILIVLRINTILYIV